METYNSEAQRTDEPKQHSTVSKQCVRITSFTRYLMKCSVLVYKLQHTLQSNQQSETIMLELCCV